LFETSLPALSLSLLRGQDKEWSRGLGMVVAQRDTGFRRQVGLQLSQHARLALQEATGSNHPASEGAHRRANQGYAQPMTGRV
jgi:hypothetical protein